MWTPGGLDIRPPTQKPPLGLSLNLTYAGLHTDGIRIDDILQSGYLFAETNGSQIENFATHNQPLSLIGASGWWNGDRIKTPGSDTVYPEAVCIAKPEVTVICEITPVAAFSSIQDFCAIGLVGGKTPWEFRFNAGALQFQTYPGMTVLSWTYDSRVAVNVRRTFAASLKAGTNTARLFCDGALVAAGDGAAPSGNANGATLRLGCIQGLADRYYSAWFHRLLIFDKALSDQAVAAWSYTPYPGGMWWREPRRADYLSPSVATTGIPVVGGHIVRQGTPVMGGHVVRRV